MSSNPAPSTSSTILPSMPMPPNTVSTNEQDSQLSGMFPFFNCDAPEGLQPMQTGSGEPIKSYDQGIHVKQEIEDSLEMDTHQTEDSCTLKNLSRDIVTIKHDLARALAMLDMLLQRTGGGQSGTAPIESLEHIEALFPLNTDEQLSNLEEMLKNTYIKDDIKRYLIGLGGNTVALATTEILRATVTDDLAAQYSWSGLKGKRSLEELEFTKLICGTVQQRIEGATRLDVRARIMAWFKQAEARRNAKKSKTRVKKTKQPSSVLSFSPIMRDPMRDPIREGDLRNMMEPNPSWRAS